MLSPYLTLTRCIRAARSISKPFVLPKLPTREKTRLKCTDAALLTTSGETIQHGGKSDGWAAIQDFRVEINMLLHSKELI